MRIICEPVNPDEYNICPKCGREYTRPVFSNILTETKKINFLEEEVIKYRQRRYCCEYCGNKWMIEERI